MIYFSLSLGVNGDGDENSILMNFTFFQNLLGKLTTELVERLSSGGTSHFQIFPKDVRSI